MRTEHERLPSIGLRGHGLAALIAGTCVMPALGLGDQCADPCVEPINERCNDEDFAPIVIDAAPFVHDGIFGCDHELQNWPYYDVYFEFTPTCSGVYSFDMCGSMGDTAIKIYTECAAAAAIELTGNDDGPCPDDPQADPSFTVELEAGTTYLIECGARRVEAIFGSGPNCPFVLNIGPCSCDADCGEPPDGEVTVVDLLSLLSLWGGAGSCDLVADGVIDVSDLLAMLSAWGPCGERRE